MEEQEIGAATDVVQTLVAVGAACVAAFVLGTVVSFVVRRLGRGTVFATDLSRRLRRPLRYLLTVVLVWIAVRLVTDPEVGWLGPVEHVLLIALIVVGAWFLGATAFVVEDSALQRYRTDVPDNRHARRVRTQIIVVRRLTVALVVLLAIAGVMLTFPGARAAGASLLASAGVISIVAGLAAQTSLANVFAGLQIAFTDAIRVDDVVVLEGEWGRIEEITMTYVVVHLWDDRRLIMPCTYFTSTPFQNWTRRAAELLGTVELDLDWDVPVAGMRAELKRLLEETSLWDQRVGILQVTEATGGFVRVRALASAADAGTLFDLRCYLREGLLGWLQREAPQGMPRTRVLGAGELRAEAGRDDDGARPGTSVRVGGGEDGAVDDGTSSSAPPSLPALAEDAVQAGKPVPRRVSVRAERDAAAVEEAAASHATAPTLVLDEGLFTGSADAERRSRAFAGPGADVIAEREQTASQQRVEEGPASDDERR
ncbi:mechanosensitive ion channel family protein [Flavimobilis marinus]|nr:mechanosensitive ion channel domain-containing protein [Flavimobilis marinus]